MKPENIKYSVLFIFAALLLMSVFITGCFRGSPSDKPPIHLNPNMDQQPKYKPQAESAFFKDGTMRTPPAGTVARGELRDDTEYYAGKNSDGSFVKNAPVEFTLEVLKRGRERYNIYCSPCHSKIGDGKGIVTEYNYIPPATMHDDRLRSIEDGHIFDVISNGFKDMPSYKHQVPVKDRWALVGYVRALQLSQNAKIDDVPAGIRDRIR